MSSPDKPSSVILDLTDLAEDARKRISDEIFRTLSDSKRDELVKAAIEHLITPSRDQWDKGRTPIEMAFIRGVERIGEQAAQEAIQKNKAKIEAIVNVAVEKALADENVVERMAKAVSSAWSRSY